MQSVLPDTGAITLTQAAPLWNSGPIYIVRAQNLSAVIDFLNLASAATLTITVDDIGPDGDISNLAAPAAFATVGAKRIDIGPGSTTPVTPGSRVQITAKVS